MKTLGSKKTIAAVALFALLVIGNGAQASSLFALDGNPAPAERQIGLFQQAFQWLSGAWTDLTVAFSADEAPQPLPSEACEAGPGIDPIGCPRGSS